MKQHVRKRIAGFTLFEIMVVVSIIAMLSSVIMVAVMNARKDARDKIRIASVEQLKLGVRLDKEQNGAGGLMSVSGTDGRYPNPPVEIGVGYGGPFGIDSTSQLGAVVPNIKADPLSTGEDSSYGYWFDSKFRCTADNQNVLYTRMESAQKANFNSVCTVSNASNPIASADGGTTWPKAEVYITIVQ